MAKFRYEFGVGCNHGGWKSTTIVIEFDNEVFTSAFDRDLRDAAEQALEASLGYKVYVVPLGYEKVS